MKKPKARTTKSAAEFERLVVQQLDSHESRLSALKRDVVSLENTRGNIVTLSGQLDTVRRNCERLFERVTGLENARGDLNDRIDSWLKQHAALVERVNKLPTTETPQQPERKVGWWLLHRGLIPLAYIGPTICNNPNDARQAWGTGNWLNSPPEWRWITIAGSDRTLVWKE